MGKKIKIYFSLLILASLICFCALSIWFIDKHYIKYSVDNLDSYLKTTISFADTMSINDKNAFVNSLSKKFPKGIRITLLDENGVVLGDSEYEVGQLENHIKREEVSQAIKSGFGKAMRYSDSKKHQVLYVARTFNGDILRFSMPLSETTNFVKAVIPYLLINLIFVFTIVTFILNHMNEKIVATFDDLFKHMKNKIVNKQDKIRYYTPFEELKPIEILFNELSEEITRLIYDLDTKNQEIENILSSMAQGFVMLSFDFSVIMVNKQGIDYLHLPESVVSDKITAYYRNDLFINALKQSKNSLAPVVIDIQSELYDLRFSITPVTDKGFVVLITDVSEIIHLEKVRSDFVANVSHELKTPLTTISGFSELVTSGFVKENDQMILFNKKIYKETKRLIRLVEDLLTLSYIENSKKDDMNFETTCVDINEIFDYVFEVTSFQMNEKNINYSMSGELKLWVNQDHIHTLILNLVENAVKYNKKNGNIHVSLFDDHTAKGFKIADTGIGIPSAELNRIFERFYRVDKARSRGTGGTGLGLSIAKHIVSLYDGEITVSSNDKGTSFTVTFQ